MDKANSLKSASRRLLKPFVKLLLNNGVSFNEFSEWVREVFVEVAEEDFSIEGKAQTSSRISVLTGIFRKDVARIRKQIEKPDENNKSSNRMVRIISAWRRDKQYIDGEGEPVEINLEGDAPSLQHLVKTYGGDVTFQAVKDEMERLDFIEHKENKKIEIKPVAYIPSSDLNEQLNLMGKANADLLSSINHNIDNPDKSRLQLSVAYQNVNQKTVDRFKRMSEKQSMTLLKKFDKWLTENAEDAEETDDSYRTGIGIYYFQDKCDDDQQ